MEASRLCYIPRNTQENDYFVSVSEEQKDVIIQKMRDEKLADDKISKFQSGLKYMYGAYRAFCPIAYI